MMILGRQISFCWLIGLVVFACVIVSSIQNHCRIATLVSHEQAQQKAVDRKDDVGNSTSLLLWSWRPPKCEDIPSLLNALNSTEAPTRSILELRRNLSLADPACFRLQIPEFAKHFVRHTKHLNLHIPKAGGTTLCDMVKRNTSMTKTRHNCWHDVFCPMWCCCGVAYKPRVASCAQQQSLEDFNSLQFIMNEQVHQGFCGDGEADLRRAYSIILREPVSRTMSHWRHSIRLVYMNKENRDMRYFADQTSVIQKYTMVTSNYMTWSLSASKFQPHDTLGFRPRREHLPTAIRTLMRMDYLLDWMAPHQCHGHVLFLMGISKQVPPPLQITNNNDNSSDNNSFTQTTTGATTTTPENSNSTLLIPHSRAATGSSGDGFDPEMVRRINELDLALYEHAIRIMAADCEFWEYIIATQYR